MRSILRATLRAESHGCYPSPRKLRACVCGSLSPGQRLSSEEAEQSSSSSTDHIKPRVPLLALTLLHYWTLQKKDLSHQKQAALTFLIK